MEHSGLGAYGDEVNPWADRQWVALLWCAAFVVPPVVSALGPAAGDAARRAVTWYAGKWLNDRRLQLAIVGFIWSGTGKFIFIVV